jgi:hypothetical protein
VISAAGPSGQLSGLILDPAGAVVPNAQVTILCPATGWKRTLESSGEGLWSAPLLPPGVYQVSIAKTNFAQFVENNIQLDADRHVRVDTRLELASGIARANVAGQAATLQEVTSTLDQVVDETKVRELPLNQRTFLSFVLLAPGANSPAYGSFNDSQGGAVNVNGAREQANNFLLDGVDNNEPRLFEYSVLPSLEAIEEFQLQSANSSAAFGYPGGAQVNIILKRGGNVFHGSLFEFLRNRHLDAKNFFDLPDCGPGAIAGSCSDRPRLDRSQFGGSLGGPLLKDRLFFFAAYESLRLRQGSTRRATVPSQLDRQAALAVVPANQRNPSGVSILNLYPAANSGTDLAASRTYASAPDIRDTLHQGVLTTDFHSGSRDTLAGHYAVSDDDRFNPFDPAAATSNLPGFGTNVPRRGDNAGGAWTRVFGPRLLQEARLGYTRTRFATLQQNAGFNGNQQLGFPVVSTDSSTWGYPTVNVAGYDSMGEAAPTPMQVVANTVHLSELLAWTPGGARHNLQFGAEALLITSQQRASAIARGSWTFPGPDSLNQLLRGVPSSALTGRGDARNKLHRHAVHVFVQDDWRITPSLTVNLGLRYEYNGPPSNSLHSFYVPDLSANSATCTPRPDCQYIAAGTHGVPSATYLPDRNNVAPRTGFAWRPSASRGLVIRGAYGIFFTTTSFGPINTYYYNPPQFELVFYPNSGTDTIQSIVNQSVAGSPALSQRFNPDFRDGYVQQWNFNIQYLAAWDTLFDVSYVGSKGTKLIAARDLNQPPPGGLGARPYPQLGPILQMDSRANSTYDAFQARAERRFGRGLTFLAAYTWSKSIDSASSFYGLADGESYVPQNSLDVATDRGLSIFHAAHRFVVAPLWELPYAKSQRWLAGWRLGLIATFQSGHPFSVFRSVDQSGTAPHPFGDLSDRPDLIADPMQPGPVMSNPDPACRALASQGGRAADQVRDPASWFNACAFAAPATKRFGTAGRNIVIGPGIANLDFSVSRSFRFKERYGLDFRVEFFNLFNHPQFDMPQIFFDSAGFTSVRSANAFGNGPPRQIQLGLRLSF